MIADAEQKKEVRVLLVMCLYLSLAQNRPEGFSAALKESNRKFRSFATLVFSSSHLPSLLRSAYFFLTLRAFSHLRSLAGQYSMFSIKNLPHLELHKRIIASDMLFP